MWLACILILNFQPPEQGEDGFPQDIQFVASCHDSLRRLIQDQKGQSKPDLSSYLVTEFRGFSLYSKPNAFRIFFVFLKTEISLYRTELGSKSLLLSLKPLKLT